MDYARIQTLLDKYWRCISTVEEERELRRFFTSEHIPPEFLPFKVWFSKPDAEDLPLLDNDFDRKVLEHITSARKKEHLQLLVRLFTGVCLLLLIAFILWKCSFLSD